MIRLRALEPEDVDLLYAIENDMTMWSDGVNTTPFSRDALRTYILMSSSDIYQDKQLRLVIEADDEPVGLVDLCNFAPQHSRIELGIALKASVRGKGYATEAIRLALKYVNEQLHLHQVCALVGHHNEISKQAFISAGFVEGGMLKDWIRTKDGQYEHVCVLQHVQA